MPEFEVLYFDNGEWTVGTRHGMVWKIWPDDRNTNADLYDEAILATKQIVETGKPLFGGWK